MPETNFRIELNYVKQVAVNNGYSSEIIDRLLDKKQYEQAINKIYLLSVIKEHLERFYTLTYNGTIAKELSEFF